VTACTEYAPLIVDRAAGDLAADDAARLDAHLETCAACRAEAAAHADVLALARLPEPSAEERAALAGFADRALATVRGADRRRSAVRRSALVFAAVAATVAFLLAPAAFRDRRPPAVSAPGADWEAPDATALWDDAGAVVGASAAASSSSTEETWGDVALAAFDDVEGSSDNE
jgi:anti-sigma factor RsiW